MTRKKILSFITALILCTSCSTFKAFGEEKKIPLRVEGYDIYDTASQISKVGWETSNWIVLATGEDYADALCAVPLAKKYDAPILLTGKDCLSSYTLAEIKRLKAKNVIVIGGEGAVSKEIETKLKDLGIIVERIYGADRYDTSVKIAERVGVKDNIAVTTGENYADAISIGAIAAEKDMPILLTQKDSLPEAIDNFIKNKDIKKSYIIGGTGVVSREVAVKFKFPYRIFGQDRYETNARVLKEFSKDLNFKNTFVAIGDGPNKNEFAYALSASPLAVKNSSAVMIVNDSVPQKSKDFAKEKLTSDCKIVGIGESKILSESVLDELRGIASQNSPDKNTNTNDNTGSTIAGQMIIMTDQTIKTMQDVQTTLQRVNYLLSDEHQKEVTKKVDETIAKTQKQMEEQGKAALEQLKKDYDENYKQTVEDLKKNLDDSYGKAIEEIKNIVNNMSEEDKKELEKKLLESAVTSGSTVKPETVDKLKEMLGL